MPKLTILDRNGNPEPYSTYADAWEDANSGDLIQIWANLNEQILLKDGVDIWIAPGVTLDNTTSSNPKHTIVDNNQQCICKIYGYGKIVNTFDNSSDYFSCFYITNPNSEITVKCDTIEGIGGGTLQQPSINIYDGKKFHLECNKVINEKSCAIALGYAPTSVTTMIEDVNIVVQKVEITRTNLTNIESIALSLLGTGFIKIDEIICKHYGHCLLHADGSITGNIRRMSSINNIDFSAAALIQFHGNGTQKLILYFDEIQALKSNDQNASSAPAVDINEGTCYLSGRRIYSKNKQAALIHGTASPTTNGFIKCNELVSENYWALECNSFTDPFTINTNYIESNYTGQGFAPSVYLNGSDTRPPKVILCNPRIKNLNTTSSSKGIILESVYPQLILNDVKIIADGLDDIIYLSNGDTVDIFNYSLFGTYGFTPPIPPDPPTINFLIGNNDNYVFIESTDLT